MKLRRGFVLAYALLLLCLAASPVATYAVVKMPIPVHKEHCPGNHRALRGKTPRAVILNCYPGIVISEVDWTAPKQPVVWGSYENVKGYFVMIKEKGQWTILRIGAV